MNCTRARTLFGLLACVSSFVAPQMAPAQANSSDQSWTSSSQVSAPAGTANPTRTRETHSESGGRTVDKTSTEAMGPDGRYVPLSETERESVRVSDTTVRNVERTYGIDANGNRTLIQQRTEEMRTFSDGQKVERTTSNPDSDGKLQTVQREVVESKQVSPDVTNTKSTVYSADGSGGLSPSVRTEQTEKKNGGATEFKKSTMLSDAFGQWTLSEVREGKVTQQAEGGRVKEENVLRPDSNGKLSVVERTVSKDSDAGGGEKRATTETYSTNVPGEAGENGLQLVKRESTVQRTGTDGRTGTIRKVERTNPGDPGAGLRLTDQAIDIVRPGTNGVAQQQTTVSTVDVNGNMTAVSVDIGKSDKPASVTVDTKAPAKQK